MTNYTDINGIVRSDEKHTNLSASQYNGMARPGELVVDLDSYQLYIGNATGNLNPVASGGGNGVPGGYNTQVQFNDSGNFAGSNNFSFHHDTSTLYFDGTALFSGLIAVDQIVSNLIPFNNVAQTLGNATHQWEELWVSGNTIYLNNLPLSVLNANTLQFNGSNLLGVSGNGDVNISDISLSGNLSTGNTITSGGNISAAGNISGTYYYGNGALLTGITARADTGNITFSNTTISTTPTPSDIIIVPRSGNAVVSVSDEWAALQWIDTANLANANGYNNNSSYIWVDNLGAHIENIDAGGNIFEWSFDDNGTFSIPGDTFSSGNIQTTGNVTAAFFIGDGSHLTNVSSSSQLVNGNASLLFGTDGSLLTEANGVPTSFTVNTATPNISLITSTNTGIATNGSNVNINASNAYQWIFNTYGVFEAPGDVDAVGNVNASGNVTGNYFIGNGSLLTGIISSYGNSNVASLLGSGNVPTVSVSGNVTGTYFIGNGALLTGIDSSYGNSNVTALLSSGNVSSISVTGAVGATTFNGVIGSPNQPNITSVGTLTNLSVAGNVKASWLYGDGSNIANINASNVNGTFTNIAVSNSLTFTGNIPSIYSANGLSIANAPGGPTWEFTSDGNLVFPDGSYYANGSLSTTGSITASNVIANTLGGTLTTNAQPNITSVGTLTTLTVANTISSGNLNVTSNVILGNLTVLGNATIPGNINVIYGNSGQFFGNPFGFGALYAGIAAGYPTVNNAVLQATASSNSQAQINFQNINSGSSASTDFVAWADTSDGSNFFVDMGIASRSYDGQGLGSFGNAVLPNDAYLYAKGGTIGQPGGNLVLGVATPTRSIVFTVGGGNSDSIVAELTEGNLALAGQMLSTGNIVSLGNVTGNYVLGNGAFLTGVVATSSYGNSNVADYLPTYSGNLGNVGVANSLGILMGNPDQGSLISNAVSMSNNTPVADGVALLNQILGKLVPPSPPTFPASQTLSISGLSTYRMANITQVNNTGNSYTVSGGATVTNTLRSATYSTSTITNAGPGNQGTVTAFLSGNAAGSVSLTGNSNGTYGNLIISANEDYHVANANITAGFWTIFSSQASGSARAGWNDIVIQDTVGGDTNIPSWYYDNSAPSAPSYTNNTFAVGTANVIYSSTVSHYTSGTSWNIGFTAGNISGNMYPTSNVCSTGSAGGAFQAPLSVNYNQTSIGSNTLPAFASANVNTQASVITGFGSSNGGPSVTINNSYNTGSHTFAPGVIVNYKTGTTGSLTFLEETSLFVGGTIGGGVQGNVYRIVNPGNSDTPVYTGNESAFNSQTGPFYAYDAAVVANVLSCNKTNYSTGYLPVGPNLSTQNNTQYFTFKFIAPSTSKFDIYYTGTLAGLYVALPGSGIDTSSTLNGWMDMSLHYSGAGQPGAGTGGNGSNGCALGNAITPNTPVSAARYTATFGTASTAGSTNNEVYVRIKLTTGQSITSLAIYPASN